MQPGDLVANLPKHCIKVIEELPTKVWSSVLTKAAAQLARSFEPSIVGQFFQLLNGSPKTAVLCIGTSREQFDVGDLGRPFCQNKVFDMLADTDSIGYWLCTSFNFM